MMALDEVKEGQKCRYIDAYGCDVLAGKVLYVNKSMGIFTVYEDLKCPPQYNDSFMDFKEDDIGKRVWFDES